MRLDPADAETLKNVSVQCLGKDYPLSQEAWDCMHEVSKIRNKHTGRDGQPDDAFKRVEDRYIKAEHENRNSSVHGILSNFGLTDSRDSESPRQRQERFRADVKSASQPWYAGVMSWIGF